MASADQPYHFGSRVAMSRSTFESIKNSLPPRSDSAFCSIRTRQFDHLVYGERAGGASGEPLDEPIDLIGFASPDSVLDLLGILRIDRCCRLSNVFRTASLPITPHAHTYE